MNAIQIVKQRFPQVESVQDANRNITIEVTSKDCNSAKVKKHKECAMAVAAKRQLKSVDGVMISLTTAYVIKGKKAIRFSVPEAVGREITSFDRNAGFMPGEYQLCKVPPASKLGRQNKGGGNRPVTHKGIAHRFQHKTEDVRSKLGSAEYLAE